MELAAQKAREVASMLKTYGDEHRTLMTPQDTLVIGADTIVAAGSEILGKPKDEEDASLYCQGKAIRCTRGLLLCLSTGPAGQGNISFMKRLTFLSDS